MQLEFSKRNVIVLGSSSGIGFAIAKMLVQNGANVCLVGRDLQKLQTAYSAINQLSQAQSNNIYSACDLTQADAVSSICELVADKWNGEVDSLVLNAGGPPFVKSVTEVTAEMWHTYFQSLFLSQITLVSNCLNNMKKNKFGRIVSISSSSIVEPIEGLVISGALRLALSAWLKSLSIEVGNYGINVTTAIIGKIETERMQTLNKNRAAALNCAITEVMNDSVKNINTEFKGRNYDLRRRT